MTGTPRGHRPKIVASGNDAGSEWVSVLTKNIHCDMDAISHHCYTTPTGIWASKGNSTIAARREGGKRVLRLPAKSVALIQPK